MLKTRLTVVLGIDHPIVLAPMGSATSPAFAAAASNAGALGVGAAAAMSPFQPLRRSTEHGAPGPVFT